jgi:2-polyprenyl-6-methoxyphenol hydroxylase-like FAD-dependent oxidoreductase
MQSATDVLIVGAGPTGLVLALWLARLGVRARIIDKTAEPGTTSRALAVQARTLELYRQIGLADTVVDRGRSVAAVNLWVSGNQVAHGVLGAMGAGISPFAYALVYPQDEHERLLIDRLSEAGVEVERKTEFQGLEERPGHLLARMRLPDGTVQACEASYVAGCDGAHSTVRDGLDTADFLAVFPLKDDGHWRLVGTVRDEGRPHENLSWDDVSRRVIEWMRIEVTKVNWFSTYHVHHRVADHFRKGRAFLLGDAAHIHSPVGGQGMNTGIGDAVNLAWKLAAVLGERAEASLLDSYEPERIAFARRLVATTDRAFIGVTSSSTTARLVRLRLVPLLFPLLFRFRPVRRLMFRTVSQTAVNYRGSSLSEGRAGALHGGDRLPWVEPESPGTGADNFMPLTSLDWQVHVYGEASDAIRNACDRRKLPLHVFAWRPAMRRTGLRRGAVYLVRPDGYVALANAAAGAAALASYVDVRKLKPRTPS